MEPKMFIIFLNLIYLVSVTPLALVDKRLPKSNVIIFCKLHFECFES
jgi:hypothetical protein